MNPQRNRLSKQLLLVVGVAFILLFISLGIILPRMLIPVAEKNIYNYLSEPLKMYDRDVDNDLLDTEIAYIYVTEDNMATSPNIDKIIDFQKINKILELMNDPYGKIIYNHKTYYYYTLKND